METDSPKTFESVRVRYFVIAWVLFVFYLPGADYLFHATGVSMNWYSWDLAYLYYGHVGFAGILILTSIIPVRLPIRRLFGREPSRAEYGTGLILSLYLLVLAWAAAYILFLPLSFWIPGFVDYWFIQAPDIIYYDSGVYPFVANLLNLLSLCVLAPILEEYAFRGLILHRWAHRYGLRFGVLASSLLFGIVHSDPLGAFFFGIGMCVLYLRTQSLILPIVCHGIYNFVVWLIELGYAITEGPERDLTLEQFQQDWAVGLVALVIAVVWAVIYLKRPKPDIRWRLPLA